jgi:catechol 2,3-dioxygenase-like lactoylglutathione lyase family enzyme
MPVGVVVAVRGLDHVVLNVADAERSVRWYAQLGLEPVRLEEWRRGEAPFVSLRIDASTIIDLQERERTGVNLDHVCLTVDDDVDLDALAASGAFDVVRGPRRLYGARGWGRGFYVQDPDGNVVELRHYRLAADEPGS